MAAKPLILATFLLGCLVGTTYIFFRDVSPCGVNDAYETASPTGKWKAVVFERNCGATTGFVTHASVLRADERLPNEVGNVLIADGDVMVRAEWKSLTELHVTYPRGAKILLKKQQIENVRITYIEW